MAADEINHDLGKLVTTLLGDKSGEPQPIPDDVVEALTRSAAINGQIVTLETFMRFVAGDETTSKTWFDSDRRRLWLIFLAGHAPTPEQGEHLANKDVEEDLIHYSRDIIEAWNIDMGAVLAAYAMIFRS